MASSRASNASRPDRVGPPIERIAGPKPVSLGEYGRDQRERVEVRRCVRVVLHSEEVEAFAIGLAGEIAHGLEFVGDRCELDAKS
ncbi:MAG TPA: hypothetical protein VEX15_03025 [Nocardioidaceae bacterium]|nr:hypothetical protein [Nocardioidaceae bacterium]